VELNVSALGGLGAFPSTLTKHEGFSAPRCHRTPLERRGAAHSVDSTFLDRSGFCEVLDTSLLSFEQAETFCE
jgi:hypothetical protein